MSDPLEGDAPCKGCGKVTTAHDYRVQMFRNDKYEYTLCRACDRGRRERAYADTGVLTTSLWLALTLEHREQWDHPTLPFLVSMHRIMDAAASFGRDIWFAGGL